MSCRCLFAPAPLCCTKAVRSPTAPSSFKWNAATLPGLGPARIEYGVDRLPRRIEQGGWTVEYDGWRGGADGLALPGKVETRRGEDRVRLVVDQWIAE